MAPSHLDVAVDVAILASAAGSHDGPPLDSALPFEAFVQNGTMGGVYCANISSQANDWTVKHVLYNVSTSSRITCGFASRRYTS